jgi:hypothetical protein
MSTSILTQKFVQDAIESEKTGIDFPIDFDSVWMESGYSRKDHAVRFMAKRLKLNRDYRSPDRGSVLEEQKYYFSLDGFKFFLAKSNTAPGDEALWRLIDIEKAYVRSIEAAFPPRLRKLSVSPASSSRLTRSRSMSCIEQRRLSTNRRSKRRSSVTSPWG